MITTSTITTNTTIIIKGFSYDRMEWYFNGIRDTYKEKGAIRGFNFSRNKAEKYAKRFFKWYGEDE